MSRRRRHRRDSSIKESKAWPMEAIYASGVSLISLIIYGALIGVSVYKAGENPNVIGGIGMLGLFIALAAAIFNITQMRTKTELKYRIICMAVSTVVLIIWLTPYVLGLIN